MIYIKMPGTAALNDEIITNSTLTQVGDQPTYSATPPITPAIIRLFCERCNFANLAKSDTSLLFVFSYIFYTCLLYSIKILFSPLDLRISISTIQLLSVEDVAVLCEFMLPKLALTCHKDT